MQMVQTGVNSQHGVLFILAAAVVNMQHALQKAGCSWLLEKSEE
jgi:hypothetical protein